MSFLLVSLALLVAAACVPTAAGMTAWGLAGGDGEPESRVAGILAAVVAAGSLYDVLASFAAFWGLDGWRWWPMWAAPVAGLIGLVVVSEAEDSTPVDRAVGVALQLAVALPAVLVLVSGRVTV